MKATPLSLGWSISITVLISPYPSTLKGYPALSLAGSKVSSNSLRGSGSTVNSIARDPHANGIA